MQTQERNRGQEEAAARLLYAIGGIEERWVWEAREERPIRGKRHRIFYGIAAAVACLSVAVGFSALHSTGRRDVPEQVISEPLASTPTPSNEWNATPAGPSGSDTTLVLHAAMEWISDEEWEGVETTAMRMVLELEGHPEAEFELNPNRIAVDDPPNAVSVLIREDGMVIGYAVLQVIPPESLDLTLQEWSVRQIAGGLFSEPRSEADVKALLDEMLRMGEFHPETT